MTSLPRVQGFNSFSVNFMNESLRYSYEIKTQSEYDNIQSYVLELSRKWSKDSANLNSQRSPHSRVKYCGNL